jgi:hypothetical protein
MVFEVLRQIFTMNRPVVLMLALSCVLYSCSYKIHCVKPRAAELILPDADSNASTSVLVIRYKAGSNFQVMEDSTTITPYTKNRCFFSFADNTDYKIIVSPQGRVHTLSNLNFNHETKKGSPGLSSEMCAQSGSYTLDGNNVQIPYVGVHGEATYVYIDI